MLSTLKKKRSPKIRMGATRRNLQTQPKILKKSAKHQIYQSERKFSQKNHVSYLKSVKERKIRIRATRRNLQAQPKMLIKIVGTLNQPIRTKKKSKKTMFRTLKV
jgi:uncharacterized Zn finger protein (UPF0148 family)